MRNILKIAALVSLLALAWGAGWLASGIGVGRVAPEATLEERERAFEESMRNVVLDGSFTVAWPEPREGVSRDRYAGTWDHGEVGGFMFGRVVKE